MLAEFLRYPNPDSYCWHTRDVPVTSRPIIDFSKTLASTLGQIRHTPPVITLQSDYELAPRSVRGAPAPPGRLDYVLQNSEP
jgi:hypothetical protein